MHHTENPLYVKEGEGREREGEGETRSNFGSSKLGKAGKIESF